MKMSEGYFWNPEILKRITMHVPCLLCNCESLAKINSFSVENLLKSVFTVYSEYNTRNVTYHFFTLFFLLFFFCFLLISQGMSKLRSIMTIFDILNKPYSLSFWADSKRFHSLDHQVYDYIHSLYYSIFWSLDLI